MHYTAVYEYTVLNEMETDFPAPAYKSKCKEYQNNGPDRVCPNGSDVSDLQIVLFIPAGIESLRIDLMLDDRTVFNYLLTAVIHFIVYLLLFIGAQPQSEVLCKECPDGR